jgi:CDP-diacylglycerol---serine O-phosphatidyltransferase
MKVLKHLPNLLTCGNLICGCLGVLMVFRNPSEVAAYFVWGACIFDFLDGFAARWLKVSSPIGKELDSLADMISFGVLPAMVMFTLIDAVAPQSVLPYTALLLAVFSALRLAKFNIDETQKDSFLGVPTPANGLFITSLIFVPAPFHIWLYNPWFLLSITLVFSALLVTPLELFALKFKNFSWLDNQVRFTFLGLAGLLVMVLKAGAIPLVILLYIIFSFISRLVKVQKN